MLKRLLSCMLLLLVSGFLPHGGGTSGPAKTALQTLVATMPVDSLQCLNCQAGGQAVSTLTHMTTGSGCYWSGIPGGGCPGSPAGGDAFSDDTMNGAHYPGTTTGQLLAFGAVGYRSQSGKEVAVIMNAGGHAATDVGGVFEFDLEVAASCLLAEGGWGHASCGTWTNPVKPARLINSSNARPTDIGDGLGSNQYEVTCQGTWTAPQSPTTAITLSNCVVNFTYAVRTPNNLNPVGGNLVYVETTSGLSIVPRTTMDCSSFSSGAGTCTIQAAATAPGTNATIKFANNLFWLASNPDGHLTNESVHEYFGINWAGGTKFIAPNEITGGGYNADWVSGLVTIFDDGTGLETRVFPQDSPLGGTVGGWCGQSTSAAWDATSGNLYCLNPPHAQLWRWTGFPGTPPTPGSPSGVPPTLATFGASIGFQDHASVIDIPDPVNAGKRALVEYTAFTSVTCNGTGYSANPANAAFIIWFDINGAGTADSCVGGANFAGTFPFVPSYLADAWAYDATNNQILIYHQPFQSTPVAEPTSFFTTLWATTPVSNLAAWSVSAGWTGAGGCSNGTTTGACSPTLGPNFYNDSGELPRIMVSDDGKFAVLSVHGGGDETEWLWRLR